jgi:low affinity Fe/Cu permease
MKIVNQVPKVKQSSVSVAFNKLSLVVTRAAGRPITSIIALIFVMVWAMLGPVFQYSDTWQLFINTGTTIITFLMVFIIQQSQNKDTVAIHMKLNELIACQKKASNRLIDVEDLTEEELNVLKTFYVKLSKLALEENDLYSSHSIDGAQEIHQSKKKKGIIKM